ncbi:hypothetical protein [Amycolatopsis minnesotensis]|uniref:Mersacidin/lichenicidin family type 2 lantibiotic n=1 Tax=Amycolatopsis minnesotensis TaxID=337894 RepID=A0ABP5BIF8_9PSEU
MSLSLASDRIREWARENADDREMLFGPVPEKRAMTTPEMTIMSSYATYWHPGPPPYAYPCCD